MIFTLERAVQEVLYNKKADIPPHLINPFLRIMETMEKPCNATLKFDQYAAPGNNKAFYEVTSV